MPDKADTTRYQIPDIPYIPDTRYQIPDAMVHDGGPRWSTMVVRDMVAPRDSCVHEPLLEPLNARLVELAAEFRCEAVPPHAVHGKQLVPILTDGIEKAHLEVKDITRAVCPTKHIPSEGTVDLCKRWRSKRIKTQSRVRDPARKYMRCDHSLLVRMSCMSRVDAVHR